jgi:hypothetical protein
MSVHKVNDLFSSQELKLLYILINSIVIPINDNGTYIYDTDNGQENCTISKSLGRLQSSFKTPEELNKKLLNIAKNISLKELSVSAMTYVEYNKNYGTPNLPPHFDGDLSEVIINYQLSSNTSWDIGLDTKIYKIEDNSALVFNPNKNIHWRPHKTFNENEYVKMIFFRLWSKENIIDNSNLRYSLDDDIYKKANELRDSI